MTYQQKNDILIITINIRKIFKLNTKGKIYMNCIHCGREINDDAEFCNNCGTKRQLVEDVESTASKQSEINTSSESLISVFTINSKKQMASMIGIISCALIIIFGIVFTMYGLLGSKINTSQTFSSGLTTYTNHNKYGGDAYTGMQNASADASNNAAIAAENVEITNRLVYDTIKGINTMHNSILITGGVLIFSVGLIGLCYFISMFIDKK